MNENYFPFVKMGEFMVIQRGNSYDRFAVHDTADATSDWMPSTYIDCKEDMDIDFCQQFINLWHYQNCPLIDEQSIVDAFFGIKRKKIIQTKSHYFAERQMPWACKIVKCEGGYIGFAYIGDYVTWCNQK